MATTITAFVPGPVLLDQAAQNALTIAATGTVASSGAGADGVDGSNLMAWTIVNDGIVASTGGVGIRLLNGGTIENGLTSGPAAAIAGASAGVLISGASGRIVNGGSISGTEGIQLSAGGSVDNRTGGMISGSGTIGSGFGTGAGVYVTGGSGTVSNSGAISGGAYAVAFARGGTVTNYGLIGGGEDGVIVQGGLGSVINAGSIVASVDDGVALFAGGSVTNAVGGSISGTGTLGAGVFITGTSGTLANSGTITGPNHIGVLIVDGGSISNAAGGLISGPDSGVFFQLGAGTLANAGSIGSNGPNGSGVYAESGGSVTNSAGGAITGTKFGVFLEGGFSTLTNAGRISGATYDGVVLGLGGTIVNNAGGTLIGGSNGVYAKYRAPADVTNAGSIGGTAANGAGIDLADGGRITNLPTAAITGGDFGVFITGAAGTVDNQGRIAGTKYDGIGLARGGSITNAANALIAGGSNGIYIENAAAGAVVNAGSIAATSAGGAAVDLGLGGSVSNAPGAVISGSAFGVFVTGRPGSIANSGIIQGYHGVALEQGGTLTNAAGASISGGTSGVFSAGGPATVVNAGSISATGAAGLDIEAGGTIANLANATVSGSAFGVFLMGGDGTIANAGTITGGSYAVKFSGSGNDRLIVDPGAVFQGGAGGGSGTNTLELASGAGGISGINNGTFFNFQSLVVDGGSDWSLNGPNRVSSLTNDGTLAVNGALGVTSAIDPESSGVFLLEGGGSLDVAAIAGSGAQMQFLDGSTLSIDDTAAFGTNVGTSSYLGPLLAGFDSYDRIDLKQFGFSGVSLNYDGTTGLLQIANGAAQVASLQFKPSGLGVGSFHAASDGATGTAIAFG
jgi:hypothetical protein